MKGSSLSSMCLKLGRYAYKYQCPQVFCLAYNISVGGLTPSYREFFSGQPIF